MINAERGGERWENQLNCQYRRQMACCNCIGVNVVKKCADEGIRRRCVTQYIRLIDENRFSMLIICTASATESIIKLLSRYSLHVPIHALHNISEKYIIYLYCSGLVGRGEGWFGKGKNLEDEGRRRMRKVLGNLSELKWRPFNFRYLFTRYFHSQPTTARSRCEGGGGDRVRCPRIRNNLLKCVDSISKYFSIKYLCLACRPQNTSAENI